MPTTDKPCILAFEMREHNILPEVEAFDLSHIFQAASMHKDGRLPAKPYVQFVMGVKNAMPVDTACNQSV